MVKDVADLVRLLLHTDHPESGSVGVKGKSKRGEGKRTAACWRDK